MNIIKRENFVDMEDVKGYGKKYGNIILASLVALIAFMIVGYLTYKVFNYFLVEKVENTELF